MNRADAWRDRNQVHPGWRRRDVLRSAGSRVTGFERRWWAELRTASTNSVDLIEAVLPKLANLPCALEPI